MGEVSKEELLNHIFELSSALDWYSAGKDYIALRRIHYNNIEWIHRHGLTDKYYQVMFQRIKEGREGHE